MGLKSIVLVRSRSALAHYSFNRRHSMSVSKKSFQLLASVCALVALVVSLACNPGGGAGGPGGTVSLHGAGATFPNPLYQKWLSEYEKLQPNIKIDYQSIGSGGGVKQLKEQTIDFGASD